MGKSRNTDKFGKYRNDKPRKSNGNKPKHNDSQESDFSRGGHDNPVLNGERRLYVY